MLFQLGLVGAAAFLAAVLLAVRQAVAPASLGPRGATASWPTCRLAWLAGLAGALAGAALFGGAPLAGDLLADARRRRGGAGPASSRLA